MKYQAFPKRLYRDGEGRTVADPVEEQQAIASGYRSLVGAVAPEAPAPMSSAAPAPPDQPSTPPPRLRRRRPADDQPASAHGHEITL